MKIASWRLICKRDWSRLNYFSGVVGGSYSGSSQAVRKSCECDNCPWISAAGACLALFIPAWCDTCLALEGDWDFGGQQPPAEGKPENPAVLEGAECSFGHFVRAFTFWAFFGAVLATVVIHELGFGNLWEQEGGEIALKTDFLLPHFCQHENVEGEVLLTWKPDPW